jgi:phospholipase/carboxylesterase
VREEKLGSLLVRVAGGTDREGGGTGPVVVLMHGFGAPGHDLVGLWRELAAPAGTRFVFPEAPLGLPFEYGFGRAWWMIDMAALQLALARGEERRMADEIPKGLAEANAKVNAMLDELDKMLTPSKLVLGGFSQGAMLACDVALRNRERPLAGLVLMSGTLLAASEWRPRFTARAGLPVFQSHGRSDPLLPISGAEQLKDALVAGGCDVTWTPFSGQHEIPGGVRDGVGRFLTKVLA